MDETLNREDILAEHLLKQSMFIVSVLNLVNLLYI